VIGRIDAFTGLPTWEGVAARLKELKPVQRIGAVGVNVTDMRGVNETHGAEGGNEVLATVARRLVESVHDGDLVARIDGDQFVVLTEFDGVGQDSLTSFSAELEAAISSEPITVHGLPVHARVKVNAAMVATPNDVGRLMESARTRVKTVGDVLTKIHVGLSPRSPQWLRGRLEQFMQAPMYVHFVDPPAEGFEVVDTHHYMGLLAFAEALMQRIEGQEPGAAPLPPGT
jgi:diguanylate cyclase (GGDEF)-like protein